MLRERCWEGAVNDRVVLHQGKETTEENGWVAPALVAGATRRVGQPMATEMILETPGSCMVTP